MKLVLKHCNWMGDWYTIEKAEHEGIEELRSTGPNSMSLYSSARVSDACVEGTAAEMLDIATAIERREQESYKRCAVDARTNRVGLWSPHNSLHSGIVSRQDADDLAASIRTMLANPPHLAVDGARNDG